MLMLLHYFAFAQSVEHMCICRLCVLCVLNETYATQVCDS